MKKKHYYSNRTKAIVTMTGLLAVATIVSTYKDSKEAKALESTENAVSDIIEDARNAVEEIADIPDGVTIRT